MALFLQYKLDNHGMGKPNISIASDTKSFKDTKINVLIPDDYNTTYTSYDDYTRLFFNNDGTHGGVYVNLFPKEQRTNNLQYTWSIDIRTTSDFVFEYIGLECSGCLQNYELKSTNNNWKRIYFTFIYNENDATNSNFVIYPLNAKQNQYIDIKNFKIEIGNNETGWIPSTSSQEYSFLNMNSKEVKDVSNKYNSDLKNFDSPYDGEFNNDTVLYVDSPRYLCAVDFSNNNFIKSVKSFDTSSFSNNYTISFFAFIKSISNQVLFSFSNSLKLLIDTYFYLKTDSTLEVFKSSNLENLLVNDFSNKWHNFTIAGNGIYNFLYIDGIKIGQTDAFIPLSSDSLIISGDSETNNDNRFTGYLSDFRIYSEVLSDDKILRNAKVSLYITKEAKLYVSSVVEE